VRKPRGPGLLRKARFRKGTRNADIGGGRFDDATRVLARLGVKNVIFDPANRPAAENQKAAKAVSCGKAATATVANVLNVIPSAGCRQLVIKQAADAVGAGGTAYFEIYEGTGTGRGKKTSFGWQENRSLESYLPEVRKVFSEVQVERGALVARRPRRQTCSVK
jgi:hypothetical protein